VDGGLVVLLDGDLPPLGTALTLRCREPPDMTSPPTVPTVWRLTDKTIYKQK